MSRGFGNIEKAVLRHLGRGNTGLLDRIQKNNQILLHNFSGNYQRHFTCALEGCERSFLVEMIPNQVIYPKYCEDHRNEHRRNYLLARRSHPCAV